MHQSRERTPKEIRGSLLGTLLGDSYITQGNQFGCEQVTRELIEIKRDLLKHYNKDVAEISVRQRENIKIEDRNIIAKPTYTIRMRHPRFKRLHSLLYRTGTKQVTFSLLKFLSLEGIALWIMDDGYMDYKVSSSTRNLRICTDSFDEISISEIIRYFKEIHDIEAKVYYHVNKKGADKKPRISFNAANSQKLISLIYPYFIDSMLYKIDLHYLPSTIKSKRCSDEYRIAESYISQRRALLKEDEDIV
ncbi:MAG: LAGLIDADG DNA endonuclease family protein [Parcubacteria group bacterium ADurb.Bin216]|nr:MAG: LAGLIDADG DNA endonuclease family protein [Parcubacteria group bacterium ADurb.Bin216]